MSEELKDYGVSIYLTDKKGRVLEVSDRLKLKLDIDVRTAIAEERIKDEDHILAKLINSFEELYKNEK